MRKNRDFFELFSAFLLFIQIFLQKREKVGQNLLTICFDEYVYYADYDYLAHSYNRSMASCFEVYMGYKEAGYDTVEEYREAMKTDQCAEGRADAYMVSFISSNLYRLSNYVAVYEEITKAE